MQPLPSLAGRSAAMRRCAGHIMLAGAALLAGCTQTQVRPTSASYPTRQWLVGSWALEGENCASDAGVVYRADGSWEAEDMAGTWRLKRGDLFMKVTKVEDAQLDGAAKNYRERIEVRGADAFHARRGDGSTRILKRCRETAADR